MKTDEMNPKGMIWLKGNAVFKGYYKDPMLTSQVIDEEGWFNIGDIGVLN